MVSDTACIWEAGRMSKKLARMYGVTVDELFKTSSEQ